MLRIATAAAAAALVLAAGSAAAVTIVNQVAGKVLAYDFYEDNPLAREPVPCATGQVFVGATMTTFSVWGCMAYPTTRVTIGAAETDFTCVATGLLGSSTVTVTDSTGKPGIECRKD